MGPRHLTGRQDALKCQGSEEQGKEVISRRAQRAQRNEMQIGGCAVVCAGRRLGGHQTGY
jgi:uncharacterized metal-binding protein